MKTSPSSGAIAAGMSGLDLQKRPSDVPRMQACAAVGQSKLMHTYERLFFGKKVVAQLLLSSDASSPPPPSAFIPQPSSLILFPTAPARLRRQLAPARTCFVNNQALTPETAITSPQFKVRARAQSASAGAARRSAASAIQPSRRMLGRNTLAPGPSDTTRITANGRPAAAAASHGDSMSTQRAPLAKSPECSPGHRM